MIGTIQNHIAALDSMKKYPKSLQYIGDLSLLERPKISIVGTRRPSSYTKTLTIQIASALSARGVCIVSGAAMGVDALAHRGAGASNTVAVMANGLDMRYPHVNATLIENIEKEGLVLSQFEPSFKATPWSFVIRNELVVALGTALVVMQADLDSGSMRSVEFAQKMQKPIFVLPHRVGESRATQQLLENDQAKAIYDIDAFVDLFAAKIVQPKDAFLEYCKSYPDYDGAIAKFGAKVFEYELQGKIQIQNSKIICL